VRDVTLREGACRVQSGYTLQVLTVARNAAVYLLSELRAAGIADATASPAMPGKRLN
jgi:hypothetical protein